MNFLARDYQQCISNRKTFRKLLERIYITNFSAIRSSASKTYSIGQNGNDSSKKGWSNYEINPDGMFGSMKNSLEKPKKPVFFGNILFPCVWFQQKYNGKEKMVEKIWKTVLFVFCPKQPVNEKCIFCLFCNCVGPTI